MRTTLFVKTFFEDSMSFYYSFVYVKPPMVLSHDQLSISMLGDISLDRTPFYAAILILAVTLASTHYLSFSVQHGTGELVIDDLNIESSVGANVTAVVFSMRDRSYWADLPLVVTLHGVSSSVSDLYAFNIELARRNMTVVSISLEGLESSVSDMDETSLNKTAFQCSEVISYVRAEYDVHGSLYGVLTHSEGFQIGARMINFTGAPTSVIAINPIGSVPLNVLDQIPGNVFAVIPEEGGSTTAQNAVDIVKDVSGLPDVEIGLMYGNISEGNAFRIIAVPGNEGSILLASQVVMESCLWMIEALQGMDQLIYTLSVHDTVYQYQIQADIIFNIALVGIIATSCLLIVSLLPERYRKRVFINLRTGGS